jgi:hypothetical protein
VPRHDRNLDARGGWMPGPLDRDVTEWAGYLNSGRVREIAERAPRALIRIRQKRLIESVSCVSCTIDACVPSALM